MALDPTAREANVKDSLKKYFSDSLEPNYVISWDKGLATPENKTLDKWISFNMGDMDMGTLSELTLEIYCCTRQDEEGFKLAQLRDTVMGYLTDITQTDSMRRIDLYRSYQSQAWVLIGGIVVQEVIETRQFTAKDETKYKILTVRLRWGSKI